MTALRVFVGERGLVWGTQCLGTKSQFGPRSATHKLGTGKWQWCLLECRWIRRTSDYIWLDD